MCVENRDASEGEEVEDEDEEDSFSDSSSLFDFGSPFPRLFAENNSSLPTNFDYVVFSGGGTKLFGFIGALDELRFSSAKGVGGCSAGALMAVLCAGSGFDVDFIRNIIHAFDFANLPSWFTVDSMMKVFTTAGLHHRDDDHMRAFFDSFLIPLFGSSDATLEDLWTTTGVHVRIQATDVLRNRVVVFDHIDYPHITIRDALWASMCVPYLMEMPLINGDMLCVDGGIICNVPYFLFEPSKTLCISIADRNEKILEEKKAVLKNGFGHKGTNLVAQHIALFTLLLNTPTMFTGKVFEDAYKETTTLSIDIDRCFVDVNVDMEAALQMEETGRAAAKAFLWQQMLHWSLACIVLGSASMTTTTTTTGADSEGGAIAAAEASETR